MFKQTGIRLNDNNNLNSCLGPQNDTVTDCPIYNNIDKMKSEFIVVAHNPQS